MVRIYNNNSYDVFYTFYIFCIHDYITYNYNNLNDNLKK